jgi:hypothetical protein
VCGCSFACETAVSQASLGKCMPGLLQYITTNIAFSRHNLTICKRVLLILEYLCSLPKGMVFVTFYSMSGRGAWQKNADSGRTIACYFPYVSA